jgi:hypothetical protein
VVDHATSAARPEAPADFDIDAVCATAASNEEALDGGMTIFGNAMLWMTLQ